MAEQQDNQVQYLLSDFNTRLREIEERSRVLRERVLLLGKNLISIKQKTEEQMQELKKQNTKLQQELEKTHSIIKNISEESGKFVRKQETMKIERMLKDFQPLEFVREKDLEEIINKKLRNYKKSKNIE